MIKTDYTKKFSHNNKTFKFQPFNSRGKRSFATKPNEIVLSKTGYSLSGDFCNNFNLRPSVVNYVVFGFNKLIKYFWHEI